MASNMGDNARGVYIITKRELKSHVKSVRMLILMVLFILAVLGGAYGMSSLSIQSDVIKTPEVVAWVFKVAADDDGWDNDLLIYFTDPNGIPVDDVDYEISFKTKKETTVIADNEESEAKSYVKDINRSDDYSILQLQSSLIKFSKGGFSDYRSFIMVWSSISVYESLGTRYYMTTQMMDLDGENKINDAVVMVIDTKSEDFEPVRGLEIRLYTEDDIINKITMARTNSFGICTFYDLEAGSIDFSTFQSSGENYVFSANYTMDGKDETIVASGEIVFDFNLGDLFTTDDSDQVLMFVALVSVINLAPLVAIVLAFDSISKERLQGSLDFLLARPVSRRSIALGKFLGTFLAIAIPVTLINIIGIFIIWGKTGNAPDPLFALNFLVATLIFSAMYILLMQILSTLMKSTATAILSGISLYLIYSLFWGLIGLGLNSFLGNTLGSDAYLEFSNRFSLLSPNGVYQLLIFIGMPGTEASDYVGVTRWAVYLVTALWLVGLIVIAVELFNKKSRNL